MSLPAPADEIFSSLHCLLLLQKHVPNFFAAVGIAPKGAQSLSFQLAEAIDDVLDSEVLREDIVIDILGKSQQRMQRVLAVAQEWFRDAIWSDDPLAPPMSEMVPSSAPDLVAIADEIKSTLKDFRR